MTTSTTRKHQRILAGITSLCEASERLDAYCTALEHAALHDDPEGDLYREWRHAWDRRDTIARLGRMALRRAREAGVPEDAITEARSTDFAREQHS